MTRVRVPGPDIEADVSAEQVAAYLLRPGSGWRYTGLSTEQGWQIFRHGRKRADLPVDPKMRRRASMLASVIDDIARAEGRHPSAVLADIAGPAVGSVGADCGSFFARKCPARMLAIVTMGYADVAKVCAREAQKESE